MTTSTKNKGFTYYLLEICTVCFSKSEPRLRPLDVEMSSKAFLVTGVLSPSSRLSTTSFWDSYITQQKKSKHSHPIQSSLKNRLTEKRNKSLTPDSSKIASTSSRLTFAFSYLGALYPLLNHSFSMTSANVILCPL